MNKTALKIVTDSSADLPTLADGTLASAPLKIVTAEKEYVDDAALDVAQMVDELLHYNGRSSTSCPNPQDWLQAFGDAENIFCITITGTLSGSYNAACVAQKQYLEQHPERKVFVMNSLSTGPEMNLIVQKVRQLADQGAAFDEICSAAEAYSKQTGLLFMLESLKNLANNGRVNPLVAKAAGLLGIRMVGKASDQGDLQPLDKCRGEQRALEGMLRHLKALGYNGGRLCIAHCINENAAKKLAENVRSEFSEADVEIYPCRGLCSFYAEKGGLLVGFEKQ